MASDQRTTTIKSVPAPTVEPSIKGAQNMLVETWVELKKTTWPTPKEARRLTMVVIVVILILGTYMGLLDWILSRLLDNLIK